MEGNVNSAGGVPGEASAGKQNDDLLNPGKAASADSGKVGAAEGNTAGAAKAGAEEGKTAGAAKAGAEGGAGPDGNLLDVDGLAKEIQEKESTAPDKYEAFTLPQEFSLEGENLETVNSTFRSLGLSQKKAQALIDLHCKFIQGQMASEAREQMRQAAEWKQTVRSRPGYEAERALALQGLRTLVTTQEEVALFRDSPLANHPAMWSLMVKVGRLVGEDSLGKGSGPAAEDSGKFHVNLATL